MRSDFAEVDVSTHLLVISNQPAGAPEALLTERFFHSQKLCQTGEVPLCRSIFLYATRIQLTELNLSPVAAVDRTRFTTQLHVAFF